MLFTYRVLNWKIQIFFSFQLTILAISLSALNTQFYSLSSANFLCVMKYAQRFMGYEEQDILTTFRHDITEAKQLSCFPKSVELLYE